MSDYIITCDDEVASWVGNDVESMKEIVRCRDCKFADWDIFAWWCTRDKQYPFEIGELRGYGERSHLDGFCSWGERK